MSHTTICYLVLAGVVVLFVWGRLPVELVAIGAALTLWATDVLSLDQALAGFGDQTVIFIAALFVVSESLDATGVTAWAGQQLVTRVGESRTRLIVLMLLLVAVVTAFISVNGSVAALVPVVALTAVRLGRSPSQLLLPLAFGAHAGSLLALTGTPVNILASNASHDAGAGGFGYFEFALVGVPLVAGTVAIVLLFGERLLPDRPPRRLSADFSRHAQTLAEQYSLGLATVRDLARPNAAGAVSEPAGATVAEALYTRESGVAEVVIPPRSELVGETVFPGMVTPSGELVVLAVQRKGEDVGPGEIELATGDTLLLQGSWSALDVQLDDPDVLVVDSPEAVRRQAVPLGLRAKEAVAILVGMVVLLATGVIAAAAAGLLAACAIIVLRVLTVEQAYRAISWTTVILVGAMISLSTAMTETGAAADLADELVSIVGDHGGYALLLGLFLLTAVLGQLISNMATALIVFPIALSAAAEIGVSAQPVLMCVTVAAAAAFLTPVATPANLMVMGPGGYRFDDYWKLGLPLLALYGVVAVLLVPVFWSL
jgi:di/tricarboxylate transporter